jgi:hypothetical protein
MSFHLQISPDLNTQRDDLMEKIPAAARLWRVATMLRPVCAMLSSRYFNTFNHDQMLNFGDEMLNLQYKVLNLLHN